VFTDTDFQQATILQIAKGAGIAQATIYKHFQSREDLLHSIAAETLRERTEGVKEHLLGIWGVVNRLRKMTWY
jgi:AcrR family transcriptional regulator